MRKKIRLAAAFVAFAATAGAPALAPAFADVFEAQRKPDKPARKLRAAIEEIHVQRAPDGDVFSGIVPCTKVLRSVWDAAQAGESYSLKFHLKYTSGGKTAVKNVNIPLKTMNISRHHPSTPEHVVVGTRIDVANKPVDENSKVTGKVHLNHKPATR